MKKQFGFFWILSLIILHPALSQDNPFQLSFGTIKTVLQEEAINFGVRYIQRLDSVFSERDIFMAQDRSLFQAAPEFLIEAGTADAFSLIQAKISGIWMFFDTTQVAGIVTPDTRKLFHVLPVSAGIETNSRFEFINFIAEAGYVPWYWSPMNSRTPKFLRYTKLGVFLQGGYKMELDTAGQLTEGGNFDRGKEALNEFLFRAKGSFEIDTRKAIPFTSFARLGLIGRINAWYDFMNSEVYYNLEGIVRFYVGNFNSIDFRYQKGSGAPNFNRGDQFGIGLTVMF